FVLQVADELMQLSGHLIKRVGELADLVRRTNRDAHRVVSLRDAIRRDLHFAQRLRNLRQQKKGKKRRQQKAYDACIGKQKLDFDRIGELQIDILPQKQPDRHNDDRNKRN